MRPDYRRKGVRAERSVAKVWLAHGFEVRNLEAAGDHLVVRPPRTFGEVADEWQLSDALRLGLITLGWDEKLAALAAQIFRDWLHDRPPIHCEVKRQERVRMPEWVAQAEAEAPSGSVPVVCWRRTGMEWRADLRLDALAELAS